MTKNILVINSNSIHSNVIVKLFQKMEEHGYFFHIFSCNPDLLSLFSEEKRWVKRIKLGPRVIKGRLGIIIFSLLLPFICLKQFITLVYLKFKKKITLVICFDWNDRLVFTPVAKLLRLQVIWLERPEKRYKRKNKILLGFLKSLFRSVNKVITFTEDSKTRLENLGLSSSKIGNIKLGADTQHQHQDDLFSNLARVEDSGASHYCFTVGLVTDMEDMHQIEDLFQSVKICLDVFSDIRIIIIGGGKNKKKVTWLARQYNLANLVYLVGEQDDLEKWWESFDVYLACVDIPYLRQLEIILEVMLARLPVIAFREQVLEEVVSDQETGFVISKNDSEELAQKIIYLQQNKYNRVKMGKKGRELVENNFTLEQQLERLEKEINFNNS